MPAAVGLLAASSLAPLHCASDEKTLGSSCIKDEDCAGGVCSGQVCIAAPPTFDSAGPVVEASVDVMNAADTAAPDTAAPDAHAPEAAAPDAAQDGATSDVTDASADSLEASSDSSVDKG
jgi:hypothetical protein